MASHPNIQSIPKAELRLMRAGQAAKTIMVPEGSGMRIFHFPYGEMEARIAASGPIEEAPKLFGDRYASKL